MYIKCCHIQTLNLNTILKCRSKERNYLFMINKQIKSRELILYSLFLYYINVYFIDG